ncbi:MAG: globin domain-containing protein [Cognatishimia sp.]
MPLSTDQMDLIRDSFEQLRSDLQPKSIAFYQSLFELAPHLKPMFRDDDLAGQGMRFMSTLGAIVDNLHTPEAMEQRFRYLGAGHRAMGVTVQDFAPMGVALIETLANTLGNEFTDETREAWTQAYADFSREIIKRGKIPEA